MKKKINIYSIAVIALLSFIIINLFMIEKINFELDFFVIFTFCLIAIISLINIKKCSYSYSLNKTYWYFNFIFFFIAPYVQYVTSYSVWGGKFSIPNDFYLKTNLLILCCNIVHLIVNSIVNKKMSVKLNDCENSFLDKGSRDFKKKNLFKFSLTFVSILCLIILINNVGFENLLSRSTNSTELTDNSMFNTIFTCLLKVIPVYVFTLIYYYENKISIINIINFIIIFIMNFPLSTTRFWMGAIFIGIFLIVYINKKNLSRNRVYDILLLSIFTIIFPITYTFKFNSLDYYLENGFSSFDFTSSYNSVDYDAYSILARSMQYVENNGVVYGKQLVGTAFFFIPRSIWNSKPMATGSFIVESQGQSYTNVSCPLLAEGFVNFGVLGSILFSIVFSIICSKLDNYYWRKDKTNNFLKIIYPYLIGLLLFYLRGALHHAVVYTFCFCIPYIFIIVFKKIKNYKGDKNA